MFKFFMYIISLPLCLYATSIEEVINQRNLFEKQKETFKDKEKQKNDGDYVSNPINIFNPTTWNKPGHGTENYKAQE